MKKYISIIFLSASMLLSGCVDLDRNPLSEGYTENWFQSGLEVEMTLNDFYSASFWPFENNSIFCTDRMTDDYHHRAYVTDFLKGDISSTWGFTETLYSRYYKMISRCNTILANLPKVEGSVSETQYKQFEGEACFFRAVAYSYLTFLYGDVPFYTENLSLEEAYKLSKTSKATVLEQIYKDFDTAIEYLPVSYSDVRRVTKGAAYAYKARTALWNSDWSKCKEAAEGCINTGAYDLEKNFRDLFITETQSSKEWIFYLTRSESMGVVSPSVRNFLPRNVGGTAAAQPSLELFCSFLCTDGKPIDESPLFDPLNPFENRDPRLKETILEFGDTLLGACIDPRPWVKKVTNSQGKKVKNNDNRTVNQYAAFNGMTLRKGVCQDWLTNYTIEGYNVLMRYADVLLMLAEAKCELGQIDAEALEAFNRVRARAYGVKYTDTDKYPSIPATISQAEFRSAIRFERRMELAWENKRFIDVLRWHIAEKAFTKPMTGLSIDLLKKANEDNWFMNKETIPEVDEDGVVYMEPLLGKNCFVKFGYSTFDASKQYVFPFPADELLVCPNIEQNPGY